MKSQRDKTKEDVEDIKKIVKALKGTIDVVIKALEYKIENILENKIDK